MARGSSCVNIDRSKQVVQVKQDPEDFFFIYKKSVRAKGHSPFMYSVTKRDLVLYVEGFEETVTSATTEYSVLLLSVAVYVVIIGANRNCRIVV